MTDGGPAGLRIGRVLGAPVVLQPSWFLVAGVVTLLFQPRVAEALPGIGSGAFAVAFAYALLLLLSVFLHELAHAVAARAVGTPPTHIALDVWGGHTALAQEVPSPVRRVGDPPARLMLRDVGGGHLVAEAGGTV